MTKDREELVTALKKTGTKKCSKCGFIKPVSEFYLGESWRQIKYQSYCKSCYREQNRTAERRKYNRSWLKNNGYYQREDVKKKSHCRYLARKALKNKELFKQNCLFCRNNDTEMHHHDYDKPLEVFWLCRICHGKAHKLLYHHNAISKSNPTRVVVK